MAHTPPLAFSHFKKGHAMTAQVERGVYLAPWFTMSGGMILISITSRHQQCGMHALQPDENPYDTLEMMWAELNMLDPLPAEQQPSQSSA